MSMHNNVFTVGDQDFEKQVLQSELPVIVDFTAEWCPPCRALAPVYEQVGAENEGKMRFARIDVDENTATPTRFNVYGFPTLIIFKGGQEVKRLVGPHPTRLRRLIDQALAEMGVKANEAATLS